LPLRSKPKLAQIALDYITRFSEWHWYQGVSTCDSLLAALIN